MSVRIAGWQKQDIANDLLLSQLKLVAGGDDAAVANQRRYVEELMTAVLRQDAPTPQISTSLRKQLMPLTSFPPAEFGAPTLLPQVVRLLEFLEAPARVVLKERHTLLIEAVREAKSLPADSLMVVLSRYKKHFPFIVEDRYRARLAGLLYGRPKAPGQEASLGHGSGPKPCLDSVLGRNGVQSGRWAAGLRHALGPKPCLDTASGPKRVQGLPPSCRIGHCFGPKARLDTVSGGADDVCVCV